MLYYGSDRRWRSPKSLTDLMDVRTELAPFVSDYRLNVIDVAFLDDETIEKFESDFQAIDKIREQPVEAADPREGDAGAGNSSYRRRQVRARVRGGGKEIADAGRIPARL